MNYSGNMPDWHQFNVPQTNEVVPSTQNVNSGHLTYIPGVSSPAFNAHTLGSDSFNKHQNDSNYNIRNFQSFNNASNGPNISNNSPLASMMQMQNCISHYGSPNARNPMLDNLNASVDHRNTTIGSINEEIGYRSNQVPFNGPIGHLNGPNCNLNASSGPGPGPGFGPGSGSGSRTNTGPGAETSLATGTGPGPSFGSGSRHGPVPGPAAAPGNIGPRSTNISSIHPGKAGPPSFMSCKGLCCNSDPNINYQQWEKFGSYQNNTSYRDNMHLPGYQIENRHLANNCNFRKDNLEGKETMASVLSNASSVDHRRNFADYKYHKDHLVHRNYSTPAGMFHGYPVQNYNYSTEHQKYPYPMKEHSKTSNMNISSSGMLKHQEQHIIAQQKYNNKQFQYQSNNMLPKGMPTLNVNGSMASSSQNAYFNSQFARNIPTEVSHECQETTDSTGVINRIQPGTFMHSSPSQHQTYQHKIAMQKFSMENHLRELSRIPGYQSHPKYKECILRYRELLKLQQSTGYQNPVQQTSCATTPINTTTVPPINLQFDQNGVLINSSYLPDDFSKLQHTQSTEQSPENMEKQAKNQTIMIVNEKCQQKQQPEQLKVPLQSEQVPSSCSESLQKRNQFSVHKDLTRNQLKIQNSENHSFDTLNTDTTNKTMIQQKACKEFANKPDLDVRQFLANWDETDDEEGATSNLPETVLNETTPVVVVSYENVDLSSKTSQSTELFKRNSLCLNETTLNNDKEGEANVIATEDCLTISYPSSESVDITETPKQTIGEGVMKPGSIIHCISNGPDEIPTIHIVDNLEISNILGTSNNQVAETLEKHKAVSFFKEVTNNETETMVLGNTEQHNKNETHAVSPNYNASLGSVNKDTNIKDANISETIQTATVVSVNNQEQRVLSRTVKNNLDITDNLDFKKQNNFVSEESHNPDDISLPDLPTSECTPISTTLNTPIHSDSEESSQNIEDLSMSTNPIEVIQNSPVISFTQSPIKIEPYGQLDTEEKIKNKALDTLELDVQKENRYKDDVDSTYEQDVTLDNFNFCTNDSKAKSAETAKDKQVKSFGTNLTRKKVFLMNSKDNDSRISETYAALTSIEYELEVQQEVTENEKDSECESVNSEYEGRHKSTKKLADSIESVVQDSDPVVAVDSFVNIVASTASNNSLTKHKESNDEIQATEHERELPETQKIKSTNKSIHTTNPTLSEIHLNAKEMVKGTTIWENKYIDKSLNKTIKIQKKNVEHSKLAERLDMKKCCGDNSNSSQGEEYSVCHATSQSKNYTTAVIKDNIILSNKRSHGTTEKNTEVFSEKLSEIRLRTDNTNEFSEEVESKRHVSDKSVPMSCGSIQSQISKTYELLQKDPKITNEGVTCITKESQLLKDYKKPKDKLCETHNRHDNKHYLKHKEHSRRTTPEESSNINDNIIYCKNNKAECSQDERNNDAIAVSKICLEQNMPSWVNLNSDYSKTSDETKKHTYSKSFIKNATSDFDIQVANVNLKIKESDIGKELILNNKGQEHVKDSLDGIKIEINVSCTERNSKGQEQNKQVLKLPVYETDGPLPYSVNTCCNNIVDSQQVHDKEQKTDDSPDICNKVYKVIDKSLGMAEGSDTATSVVDTNMSAARKKGERNLSEANESAFTSVNLKEACNLTSKSQILHKLLHNNMLCKNTQKAEVIENTNYSFNNGDMVKSNCAISNTAITNANDKMLIKMKSKFDGEGSSMNKEEGDEVTTMQKQSSNFAESSSQTRVGASKESDEKEVIIASQMLKNIEKLPGVNFMESSVKSANALNTLDISFDKIDYRKYSSVNFDRVYARLDGIDEFDDSCMEKWKKPKINNIFEDCDMFQSTSGYINPTFSSINKLEDLHTVPVYTTKDGKISYSPNRKFTYHELMMEARKREGFSSTRRQHYTDTWNNYYSSKFRKFYKKRRHHELSHKKKHEFKDMKYLYERKRNCLDEFCMNNHVKYKDCAHSFQNDNAVWTDYCKINKIYSSSESEEEIIDRSKNRIIEASSYRKSHIIENKIATIVPKSCKVETVADDVDMKMKSKESSASDVNSPKDVDTCSKEIQVIQPPFIDNNEVNENCQNAEHHNVNDIPTIQAQTSFTLHPNRENGEGHSKIEEKTNEFAIKSYDFDSKSVQLNENKDVNVECTNTNIITIKNQSSSVHSDKQTNVRETSSSSKLFKEISILNNNERTLSSLNPETKEPNTSERTLLPENDNNFENIYHTQISEDMKTKPIERSKSEIDKDNCSLTKAISELNAHAVETIELESQDRLKLNEFKTASMEIAKISPQKDITETDERLFIKTEKCILECEQEHICIVEKTQVLKEEQTCKESANKDIEENIEFLKYEKSNSPSLNSIAYASQEECESHAKNNENINTDCQNTSSVEAKKCEVSSTNLPKDTVHVKNKNIIEDLILSNKNETEFVQADINEISTDCSPISPVEQDANLNRDSSVEKEMPVLNMYCAIENSSTKNTEYRENETEESKQKEEEYQLTSLESYKSINHLPENDTDIKTIPKLVIKKTDHFNQKSGCSLGNIESENSISAYDAKVLNEIRPKIPKMIIVKSRSRSVTPTTDILEKSKSERTSSSSSSSSSSKHTEIGMHVDNSDSEVYTSKSNNYKNKVPRVTIKLEDISSKDLKLYLKRKAAQKNSPKLTIKKSKTKENKISSAKFETEDTSEMETTDSDNDDNKILQEPLTSSTEKVPKLKLKRQEEDKCLSSEMTKGKDLSNSKIPVKKTKRSREEDTMESIKCDDTAINDEIKKKYPQCVSEKIPKVIIKRTQIGAEFKCEISKSKKTLALQTSKWQPKVKLQRLQVLDFMVKDLKQSNATSKDKSVVNAIVNIPVSVKDNIRNTENNDSSHDSKVKLCRSSSASSLSPINSKQRRLSDCDYIKSDTLTADFIDGSEDKHKSLDKNKPSIAKAIDNETENISLKRKIKIRSFSQNKSMDCNLNDESEGEISEAVEPEDVTESSFMNRFVDENNDLTVARKEYSYKTKETMSCIGDKFLMSGIVCSGNFDDNGNSIIKVDSSDESQTTIELLPASPDSSDDESKSNGLEKRNSLHTEHAMPTQLELELELIDNNNAQRTRVITPKHNELNSMDIEKYGHEDAQLSSWNTFNQNKHMPVQNEPTRSPERKSNDYFYCNDLLVKEVLAAKETLKKCLMKSANKDTEERTSRPKTLAEKKQGLSFSFRNIKESHCDNDNKNAKGCKCSTTKNKEAYKCLHRWNIKESEEKCFEEDKHSSVEKRIELKDSQDGTGPCSMECSTASTCGYTSVPELTTISLKASKKFGRFMNNDAPSNVETDSSSLSNKHDMVDDAEKSYQEKFEERTTTSSQDQKNETKLKEDNMPLLVPEFALNFDSHSDRDSSRSPPVITNQEEVDNVAEEAKNEKSKVIIPIEKVEEEKQHSYEDYEMTIADIITQLAYHEKATVRHKRYCNLCERWFPTTSRHRRHLAGYQHRYMELSQRKSIHALFVLFTGKPCPRLRPANVIRNDCSIGELTPLQIAVQDVAKYIDHSQKDLKTKE